MLDSGPSGQVIVQVVAVGLLGQVTPTPSHTASSTQRPSPGLHSVPAGAGMPTGVLVIQRPPTSTPI
jgi:hypothetical protein